MEPNIPVGSDGRRRQRAWSAPSPAPSASSARAPAASGSPTGRWSTSSGRCGRRSARRTSSVARSRRSTYTPDDADGLFAARAGAAHGSRRPRSAQRRAPVRQRVRPGHAGGRAQAGRFFGNDDVLYLMEDMATGEIRLSILWEWLHKAGGVHRGRSRDRRQGRRSVHAAAVRPAAARGVREAAGGEQPRRARRLEDDDAADRARDRRDLRASDGQAAVVHRPAQPQPGQRRSRRSAARGSPPTARRSPAVSA